MMLSLTSAVSSQNIVKNKPSNIKKVNQEDENKFHSPFRYLIIAGETKLEKYVNRFPDDNLYLQILIEDRAFNEENLTTLFKLLSKRFSTTKNLTVEVYTNLDAVKTPEEQDHSRLYGPMDNYYSYKNAYYNRNIKGEQSFVYSIPNFVTKKSVVIIDSNEK